MIFFNLATIISLLGLASNTISCEKAIFEAVQSNNPHMIDLAIAEKASSIFTDSDDCPGWKPLHSAAMDIRVKEEVVNTLLNNKAPIDAVDFEDKMTALHVAAERDNYVAARVLCKNGANLLKKDSHGRTALQIACSKGSTNVVPILLENMTNISNCDKHGNNALHLIARSENFDYRIVDALVDKDPTLLNVRNKKGLKPCDCAKSAAAKKYIDDKNSFGNMVSSIFSW